MLGDRATQALIHARRGSRPAVLLVVHLNNIALVSDGFGHTETDKVPIVDSAHVDYLFHRMFSTIRLLLKASHRGG